MLKILYVMDPMDRIQVDADSTFVMQLEAQSRGHEQFHALPSKLVVKQGVPGVLCRKLQVNPIQGEHFSFIGGEAFTPLETFDAVLMRKDPPFNMDYIYATYLLELAPSNVFIMNRPDSLRSCNEKLYSLQFPRWIPKTIVAADSSVIREFCEEVGGKAVIKPLDGAGGEGIFLLAIGDPNWNAIVEQVTGHGRHTVVVQEYIPAIVTEGDKRVILIEGVAVGAIRRVPPKDDLRGNIHVGASCEPGELSVREREMCRELGEAFKEAGHWGVGIDIIGGYLTEINVTSPTGIQEINRLDNVTLEVNVVDMIERKCA